MKRPIQMAALILMLTTSIPVASATEIKCSGDAAHAMPPVPNYPSHIRNVVWRNKRALCEAQVSTADAGTESSNAETTTSPAVPTRSQKR